MSGRPDSNWGPPAPKAGALPLRHAPTDPASASVYGPGPLLGPQPHLRMQRPRRRGHALHRAHPCTTILCMLPLALTLPDNVPIIQAVVFHGSPTVPDIGQLRSAARGWIAVRVAPTMRAILDEIVRGPLCIEIRPTESVRLPPYLGHCGHPDA